jgi:hypothetical protein
MLNLKLTPLIVALLLLAIKQNAQISAYTFSQSIGNYGPASTGTLVGPPLQDDDVTSVVLPFSFLFNATSYTTINVCANGYLSFSNISGSEYNPISDLSTQNIIAPFGQDMVMLTPILADITTGSNTLTNCSSTNAYTVGDVILDFSSLFGNVNPTITAISGNNIVLNVNATTTQTGIDVIGLNGYIKQNVFGTSPNRVCEFEYRNFARYKTYDEAIQFKVRLFETTNKIEVIYGNIFSSADITTAEVGLKGSTNSDFNSRKVTPPNIWSTSLPATLITDNCTFSSALQPANGQSYMWGPLTCSTPVLTVTSSNSTICSGQSVTLTASGATTYTWASGSNSIQLIINPTTTSSYSLVGANAACTSSISYIQNVAQNPTLTISQTKTLICVGETATLTGNGANTYTWNTGPNTSQFVVSPTVTATYTLIGSNGNCVATNTVLQNVTNCTGIINNDLINDDVIAYPNPFTNVLNVKNNGSVNDVTIKLMDVYGRVVEVFNLQSNNTININTEALNRGFYFLSINSDDKVITKKLVKR